LLVCVLVVVTQLACVCDARGVVGGLACACACVGGAEEHARRVVRAWSVSLRVLGVQCVAGTRVCGGSSGDVGLVCVYLCSHAVCWWWCCLCWWWQCVVVWWVGAEVRGRVVGVAVV
jgi:hypothetical protein